MSVRRKPLFYIVNLIVPTVIITMISLVGFFMPSTADGERNEKMTLGITTLLSMSILLLMVSDQMPITSNYVPLIGRFYLMMIALISIGTLVSSIIIIVQRQGLMGQRLHPTSKSILLCLSKCVLLKPPKLIMESDGVYLRQDEYLKTFESSRAAPLVSPETFDESARIKEKTQSQNSPHLQMEAKNGIDNSKCKTTRLMNDGDSLASRLELHNDTESPERISLIIKTLKDIKSDEHGINPNLIPPHIMAITIAEFEWAASTLERASLVIFLLLLFMASVGVLTIGAYFAGVWDDNEMRI